MASEPAFVLPERSGSREKAREMLAGLNDDLSDESVLIDCGGVWVATASFIDEIVKIVLEERRAQKLRFQGAPERTAERARSAGEARGVADRLEVLLGGP